MSRRGLPTNVRMRHDYHFVEQLSSRGGAPVGRMIPIDRITINPNQPRVEMGDLSDLVASIRDKGVLEPLLVKPLEFGQFMIISGERRFRASKLAGLGEVPCIEMDVDEATMAEIALIENLQRKDLTPFEEADGLRLLAEHYGYTHQEIAERIGKSRSSVTEVLSLAVIPAEIREQCRRADIQSKSLLLQIARQPDEASMRQLVGRIQTEGIGRDTLRQERRESRPGRRARSFVYRYRHDEFTLEMRFRRSRVSRAEIIERLTDVVSELSAPTD